MEKFKTIVVAVDFSPVSRAALRTAVGLAKQLACRVKIVHAVPVQVTGLPMDGGPGYVDPDLHQQHLEGAKRELERFVAEYADAGTGYEIEVLSGFPTDEVNRAAQEAGADLIVMGTHGRTGLRHLIMGSVAESVIKKSKIPVLCVKG
ncbi:MAG: universal stress protein [Gammaproteobacteria bacterium]|nr:universal stress protein [Gammaproteobacteria bacterium]